jgi:hypothetical protein
MREEEPVISDAEDAADIPRSGAYVQQAFDRTSDSFMPRRIDDLLEDPTIPEWRKALLRSSKEQRTSLLVKKFREFLSSGGELTTGDPYRAIGLMLEAARKVLEAKSKSKFDGAEVDLLVHREISQIAEAAERATENLQLALETMLQNCKEEV